MIQLGMIGIEHGLMAAYGEALDSVRHANAALAGEDGPNLLGGHVSDAREGRRTPLEAVEVGVPGAVVSAARCRRLESRGDAEHDDQLLSAMRKQFGGHEEKRSA